MNKLEEEWVPSMPFPPTAREKHEKREQERERNRAKNRKRREAKKGQTNVSSKRLEAGKQLRHAFGGAFGHAPENVKFMAAQGTTLRVIENPRGVDLEEQIWDR
jgi:hypothetical protein